MRPWSSAICMVCRSKVKELEVNLRYISKVPKIYFIWCSAKIRNFLGGFYWDDGGSLKPKYSISISNFLILIFKPVNPKFKYLSLKFCDTAKDVIRD
jgi:hypothetical protein